MATVGKDITVPIAGRQMMSGAKPYSEWLETILSTMVTDENPEAGRQLYNQGQAIFWPQYVDWAIANPLVLKQTSKMYVSDNGAWILQRFRLNKTDQVTHRKTLYRIEPQLPSIGTRKTPSRILSSKVKMYETHSEYRQEGASFDYYHLKTEDGRREWDIKLSAIMDDMYAALTFECMNVFGYTPDAYRFPEKGFAYMAKPMTARDVFAIEQTTFGMLTKDPFSFWTMCAKANRTFAQHSLQLSEIIMSRTDAYFMTKCNEVNVMFDKSGYASTTNKNYANMPSELSGVKIAALPFIETTLHNNTDEYVLMTPVATGTQAGFYDRTRLVDSKEYRSYMRDIEYVSWNSNDWDKYRFNEHFHHCVEFYPVDDGKGEGKGQGELNVSLLMKLADNAGKSGDNIFARTGCLREGNERHLSPFLRYMGRDAKGPYWWPCRYLGELTEAVAKTQYFMQVYETMHLAITKGFTDNDHKLLNKYLTHFAVDDELLDFQSKLMANLYSCTGDHSFTEGLLNGHELEDIIKRMNIVNYNCRYVKDDSVLRDNGVSHVTRLNEWRTYVDAGGHAVAYASHDEYIKATKAAFFRDKRDFSQMSSLELDGMFEVDVPGDGQTMSDFARRYLMTYRYDPALGFAARLVLAQRFNIAGIDMYYDNNIAIPLGAKNLRPRERQWMRSFLALSYTAERKVGDFNFSGFDSLLNFDPETKQFYISFDMTSNFMLDDDRYHMWLRYVAGGPIIGGKGFEYLDQHRMLDTNYDASDIAEDMRKGKSNIAIVQSYNCAIEEEYENAEMDIDIRGFFSREDFAGRLHYAPADFDSKRQRPMFSGQFMFNFIHKFIYSDSEFDISLLNHRQIADRRNNNFHCHQTTIRRWSPIGGFEETRSTHPWGEQLPGCRDRQQGFQRVFETETSSNRVYNKKLKM